MKIRLSFLLLLIATVLPGAAFAQGKTQVSLRLDHIAMTNGGTFVAAVELAMPEGWHTYWQNPSDSGLGGKPTTIEWTLPLGITAGPILWPIPTKLKEDDAAVYAYDGKISLLVPLTVASNTPPGQYTLKAMVKWLECKKECVLGDALAEAPIQIGQIALPDPHAPSFREAQSRLAEPQRFPVSFSWLKGKDPLKRELRLTFAADQGSWDFYPFPAPGLTFGESSVGRPNAAGQVLVGKAVEIEDKLAWPERISGLLVEIGPNGSPVTAYEILSAKTEAAQTPGSPQDSNPDQSFLLLLGFAFVGGLILNIMPCVLPVIALKILGFVRQSQESPGRVRRLGLGYGAGVLASFGLLAGVMIALNAANRTVHQGILFQSHIFLVAMTALVVLIALNLFGVFEVALGGRAIESADALARREGLSGAFFNGVLATVLATPCSAPFLSLSLGFALQPGQNPWVTLALYQMAGLGLALPYVILSFQPRWIRLLPKPGPWMERFKVLMGFPMLGTAVWLFLLVANHYDKDSLLWFGFFLVMLSIAAWLFGEFIQRGSSKPARAWAFIVVILLGGYYWMLESEMDWRHPPEKASALTARVPGKHKIPWEVWSPAAVQAARDAGRPVFVDFTADYCTTCQRNARAAIEVPAVIKKLAEINAVPMIADFSKADPQIASELRKFKRSGVPLVLVYSVNLDEEPRVLPEFLGQTDVLEALDWATGKR